jgi:hypothetical protein
MLKLWKLQGSIYGAPVDTSGVLTGTWRRVGNMYPLNLKITTKTATQESAEHDRGGQIIGSTSKIEEIIAEGTLRQMEQRSFIWAVAGAVVAMLGEGGNVAAADSTALAPGDYTDLPHEGLSNFELTDAAGLITYDEGVDYILDAELGMWTPIAGGGITAADICKVSYDFAAKAGQQQVTIATTPEVRLALRGNLINTATGEKMRLYLRMVVVSSPDGINLISDIETDYEELALEFSIQTPPGATNPGTIDGIPL